MNCDRKGKTTRHVNMCKLVQTHEMARKRDCRTFVRQSLLPCWCSLHQYFDAIWRQNCFCRQSGNYCVQFLRKGCCKKTHFATPPSYFPQIKSYMEYYRHQPFGLYCVCKQNVGDIDDGRCRHGELHILYYITKHKLKRDCCTMCSSPSAVYLHLKHSKCHYSAYLARTSLSAIEAEFSSRKRVKSGCVFIMVAGIMLVVSLASVFMTASAFTL